MCREHQSLKDSGIRGDFYKTKEDMGDIQPKTIYRLYMDLVMG